MVGEPAVARDVSAGASDPYVARASVVVGDGNRLQSTASAAANDLARDRDTVKTYEKEYGAVTAFVEGFHDETGDYGSQVYAVLYYGLMNVIVSQEVYNT